MKSKLKLLIVLYLFFAGSVFADQTQLKWSQMPNLTPNTISVFDVYPTILADDWICTNGLPITDIRWWGSYWFFDEDVSSPVNTPQHPDAFIFFQYSDVPNDHMNEFGYSYPGDLLNVDLASFGDYTVTYFTTIAHDTYFEHVYQYDFTLTLPWSQQMNDIYWLGITALYSDPEVLMPWSWREAETPFNDAAVIDFGDDPLWIPYDGITNLSFELATPVPEPGAMLLFGFGIFSWFCKRLSRKL